jgi:hypothetical protein
MKFGFQPVNLSVQFYGNAVHPTNGSPWSMRLQLAFLFPKLSRAEENMMLEKHLKQLDADQQKPAPKYLVADYTGFKLSKSL